MTGIDRIREALQFIDASDRDKWVSMGMAIKSKLGDTGFDVWETWSQQAESFNGRDARDVWKSIRASGKVMEECKAADVQYIEMPVAYDALTVVINPKNSFLKQATVAELKAMWEPTAQGKVTRWSQVNPAWPDAPIKLYGAGADSGTFEYFTEAIVGKAKSSRGDYTASEDDNVLVQGVSRDINALGYFGYAYYAENQARLKGLPIVNPKTGKAVEPSAANVEDASYQPLSRPIFVYVKAKSLDKPEVKEFVDFYMKNAEKLVREVKYVPLPKAAYEGNLKHARDKKYGSVFGGRNEVGITIEELMKREAAL